MVFQCLWDEDVRTLCPRPLPQPLRLLVMTCVVDLDVLLTRMPALSQVRSFLADRSTAECDSEMEEGDSSSAQRRRTIASYPTILAAYQLAIRRSLCSSFSSMPPEGENQPPATVVSLEYVAPYGDIFVASSLPLDVTTGDIGCGTGQGGEASHSSSWPPHERRDAWSYIPPMSSFLDSHSFFISHNSEVASLGAENTSAKPHEHTAQMGHPSQYTTLLGVTESRTIEMGRPAFLLKGTKLLHSLSSSHNSGGFHHSYHSQGLLLCSTEDLCPYRIELCYRRRFAAVLMDAVLQYATDCAALIPLLPGPSVALRSIHTTTANTPKSPARSHLIHEGLGADAYLPTPPPFVIVTNADDDERATCELLSDAGFGVFLATPDAIVQALHQVAMAALRCDAESDGDDLADSDDDSDQGPSSRMLSDLSRERKNRVREQRRSEGRSEQSDLGESDDVKKASLAFPYHPRNEPLLNGAAVDGLNTKAPVYVVRAEDFVSVFGGWFGLDFGSYREAVYFPTSAERLTLESLRHKMRFAVCYQPSPPHVVQNPADQLYRWVVGLPGATHVCCRNSDGLAFGSPPPTQSALNRCQKVFVRNVSFLESNGGSPTPPDCNVAVITDTLVFPDVGVPLATSGSSTKGSHAVASGTGVVSVGEGTLQLNLLRRLEAVNTVSLLDGQGAPSATPSHELSSGISLLLASSRIRSLKLPDETTIGIGDGAAPNGSHVFRKRKFFVSSNPSVDRLASQGTASRGLSDFALDALLDLGFALGRVCGATIPPAAITASTRTLLGEIKSTVGRIQRLRYENRQQQERNYSPRLDSQYHMEQPSSGDEWYSSVRRVVEDLGGTVVKTPQEAHHIVVWSLDELFCQMDAFSRKKMRKPRRLLPPLLAADDFGLSCRALVALLLQLCGNEGARGIALLSGVCASILEAANKFLLHSRNLPLSFPLKASKMRLSEIDERYELLHTLNEAVPDTSVVDLAWLRYCHDGLTEIPPPITASSVVEVLGSGKVHAVSETADGTSADASVHDQILRFVGVLEEIVNEAPEDDTASKEHQMAARDELPAATHPGRDITNANQDTPIQPGIDETDRSESSSSSSSSPSSSFSSSSSTESSFSDDGESSLREEDCEVRSPSAESLDGEGSGIFFNCVKRLSAFNALNPHWLKLFGAGDINSALGSQAPILIQFPLNLTRADNDGATRVVDLTSAILSPLQCGPLPCLPFAMDSVPTCPSSWGLPLTACPVRANKQPSTSPASPSSSRRQSESNSSGVGELASAAWKGYHIGPRSKYFHSLLLTCALLPRPWANVDFNNTNLLKEEFQGQQQNWVEGMKSELSLVVRNKVWWATMMKQGKTVAHQRPLPQKNPRVHIRPNTTSGQGNNDVLLARALSEACKLFGCRPIPPELLLPPTTTSKGRLTLHIPTRTVFDMFVSLSSSFRAEVFEFLSGASTSIVDLLSLSTKPMSPDTPLPAVNMVIAAKIARLLMPTYDGIIMDLKGMTFRDLSLKSQFWSPLPYMDAAYVVHLYSFWVSYRVFPVDVEFSRESSTLPSPAPSVNPWGVLSFYSIGRRVSGGFRSQLRRQHSPHRPTVSAENDEYSQSLTSARQRSFIHCTGIEAAPAHRYIPPETSAPLLTLERSYHAMFMQEMNALSFVLSLDDTFDFDERVGFEDNDDVRSVGSDTDDLHFDSTRVGGGGIANRCDAEAQTAPPHVTVPERLDSDEESVTTFPRKASVEPNHIPLPLTHAIRPYFAPAPSDVSGAHQPPLGGTQAPRIISTMAASYRNPVRAAAHQMTVVPHHNQESNNPPVVSSLVGTCDTYCPPPPSSAGVERLSSPATAPTTSAIQLSGSGVLGDFKGGESDTLSSANVEEPRGERKRDRQVQPLVGSATSEGPPLAGSFQGAHWDSVSGEGYVRASPPRNTSLQGYDDPSHSYESKYEHRDDPYHRGNGERYSRFGNQSSRREHDDYHQDYRQYDHRYNGNYNETDYSWGSNGRRPNPNPNSNKGFGLLNRQRR